MALAPKSINTRDSESRSTKIFSLFRSRCTTPFLKDTNSEFLASTGSAGLTATWLNWCGLIAERICARSPRSVGRDLSLRENRINLDSYEVAPWLISNVEHSRSNRRHEWYLNWTMSSALFKVIQTLPCISCTALCSRISAGYFFWLIISQFFVFSLGMNFTTTCLLSLRRTPSWMSENPPLRTKSPIW